MLTMSDIIYIGHISNSDKWLLIDTFLSDDAGTQCHGASTMILMMI